MTVGSVALDLKQWSERTGIPRGAIEERIAVGWPAADAVTVRFGGNREET